MATILLSAAGAAVGAGFSGTFLGLTGAVIGRAVGAAIGQAIDQRVLGSGSGAVDVGKVDRFRLTSAGEGAPVARVWGRVRLGGQVIWASRFEETVRTSGGGKGIPSGPTLREYSYSVSLAIALCEGEIARVGRIWADGQEIERDSIDLRVYRGSEDQLPDPKISAVEGATNAPAYRGIAYVVIENLDLARFGNRVPLFSFEVVRMARRDPARIASDLASAVRAVALIPGTGEYSLATTAVHYSEGPGENRSANVNSPSGVTDLSTALVQLTEEAPACGAVSLIVSWFGDDLRCGACTVRPKVENLTPDGVEMAWRAGGIGRAEARLMARLDGRPVYGGTPSDRSVVEGIRALRAAGQKVMFYPFVLMEQLAGNALPDPYGGAEQPVLPWRGRITASLAPGQAGSPDRTAAAEAEVADFFGSAELGHFVPGVDEVAYAGPDEWRYRRFILHYAHLCALAGGVDAFCVGSELVGLTQIRGEGDSFPAVAALRRLVGEVRAILGPETAISYAADWSEFFGHTDRDGNRYFHLDPLWADKDVDFIGIDVYTPISDWRDGDDHADAGWKSIYSLDYLKANIAGGEGFDWFYGNDEARRIQLRTPITDGAYGEPWIWRFKDLRSWWENRHFDRVAGLRAETPSPWVPQSKPFWFTELGCPAVDKATNEPNKFIDPKSSESRLPRFSDGRRDDTIQMQYLRAMSEFWDAPGNNPVSEIDGRRMLDTSRCFVWAWDARPFPWFPANDTLWGDGANYSRGHWVSGRITNQPLAAIVAEICAEAGVTDIDVEDLHGAVRGYVRSGVGTPRAALQTLMLAYGFDAAERDGVIRFTMREGRADASLGIDELAVHPDFDAGYEIVRLPEAEIAGRVRLGFIEAEADFAFRTEETVFADDPSPVVSESELPLMLTRAEGQAITERWLGEARVARDAVRFALPPERIGIGAGDVVDLAAAGRFRIDRVEQGGVLLCEGTRVDPGVYRASAIPEVRARPAAFVAPVPVYPVFMDLPLLTGQEDPIAPHVAIAAVPWPGAVAVWEGEDDANYRLNRLIGLPATVGVTETPLAAARPGIWDRGPALRVRIVRGALSSASPAAVLAGANAMAIGNGSPDGWEVFQFAEAEPVAPSVWNLRLRLRGQAGTDGVMPAVWPSGSLIVLIDGAVRQIGLLPANRGVARDYRVGVAARGVSHAAAVRRTFAFDGVGLRPYAPAHLRLLTPGAADLEFGWIRRTRFDGDSWASEDVPLGETAEAYRLRVIRGGAVLREETVGTTRWRYDAPARAQDGTGGAWRLEVAQVSDRFGPGPFTGIDVNE
jgi:hypothetical protein